MVVNGGQRERDILRKGLLRDTVMDVHIAEEAKARVFGRLVKLVCAVLLAV